MDAWESPVPDPKDERKAEDLIVGTITAPAWLHRIPGLAWLLIGLAIVSAAIELIQTGPLVEPSGIQPLRLVGVVSAMIFSGAMVALPAAVLLGRDTAWRGPDWLLRGAVVLALARLAGLALQTGVLVGAEQLFDSSLGGSGPLGDGQPFSFSILWSAAAAALAMLGAGLAAIGLRARIAAGDTNAWRPALRWPFVVAGIFASVVPFSITLIASGVGDSTLVPSWLNIAALAVYSAVPLAWAAFALAAVRGRASAAGRSRGWSLTASGAIVILASAVVEAGIVVVLGYLASLPESERPSFLTNDLYFVAYAGVGILQAAGSALLLAGFAAGPGTVEVGSSSGLDAAGSDLEPRPV